jgi:hypothetical protein
MATEKQWIVRYKHYVSPDAQSEHVTTVKALTDDTATPFSVAINEEAKFSIGHETKGYLAKFDDDTKAQLEALPEVRSLARNDNSFVNLQGPRCTKSKSFNTTST